MAEAATVPMVFHAAACEAAVAAAWAAWSDDDALACPTAVDAPAPERATEPADEMFGAVDEAPALLTATDAAEAALV